MGALTVRCDGCGAANRLPAGWVERPVRCGRCRAALRPEVRAGTVTDATFEAEVVGSPLPTLVDCWAPWCGPCRTLAPVIDELAREYGGRARVLKLNVDESPAVAARYAIGSIPTLLFFHRGRLRDRLAGAASRAIIAERLAALLHSDAA